MKQRELIAGIKEVDELKGKPVEPSRNTFDLPGHLRELYVEIQKSAYLKKELAKRFKQFLKKY